MAHQCNAHCRGDEHTDVVWTHERTEDLRAEELRYHCRLWGLEYVRHELAREAVPRFDLIAQDYVTPVLLTYKEG
jgi:hypothetical protein